MRTPSGAPVVVRVETAPHCCDPATLLHVHARAQLQENSSFAVRAAGAVERGAGMSLAPCRAMRVTPLVLLLVAPPVLASPHGGSSGGGGGRLAQVSSGLATASGSAGGAASSATLPSVGTTAALDCQTYWRAREADPSYRATILEHDCSHRITAVSKIQDGRSTGPGASIEGFAGAQKVVESDGSVSVALGVVDERLRLDGSFSQYFENEMSGARITMMVPELAAGVRLLSGPTQVWVDGGVMIVKTHDPRGDASVTGPSLGVRAEHGLTAQVTLVGRVETAFLQDGVHAWAGRAGIRFHHVEAAFRVFDLDVGPALYGPELGVGF